MWNEAEFGRDDEIVCDITADSLGRHAKPCGMKTWVTDDDTHGYVSYECERGHHFAIQYDDDRVGDDDDIFQSDIF